MERFANTVPDAGAISPTPRADLATYPLDDELVVYDPESGRSFVLNATGNLIWSLCNGTRSCEAIADELADRFGISREQALSDVQEMVDEFREANLLA